MHIDVRCPLTATSIVPHCTTRRGGVAVGGQSVSAANLAGVRQRGTEVHKPVIARQRRPPCRKEHRPTPADRAWSSSRSSTRQPRRRRERLDCGPPLRACPSTPAVTTGWTPGASAGAWSAHTSRRFASAATSAPASYVTPLTPNAAYGAAPFGRADATAHGLGSDWRDYDVSAGRSRALAWRLPSTIAAATSARRRLRLRA